MLPIYDVTVGTRKDLCCGEPAIFVHVRGCNLRCIRKQLFDSAVCVFAEKTKTVPTTRIAEMMAVYPNINNIVFCDGEPLLYKRDLESVLRSIWRDGLHITIETNGTISLLNPLGVGYKVDNYVINVRDYNHLPEPGKEYMSLVRKSLQVFGTEEVEKMREVYYSPSVLTDFILYSSDCYFKFVVTSREEMDSIENVFRDVHETLNSLDAQSTEFFSKRFDPSHVVVVLDAVNMQDDVYDYAREECLMNNWRFIVRH